MNDNRFSQFLTFLERLDEVKIPYQLQHSRDNAIMITAFAPGEYWEIEFIDDGEIEIERYRSDGKIHDASILDELFALCSDTEPSPTPAANPQ